MPTAASWPRQRSNDNHPTLLMWLNRRSPYDRDEPIDPDMWDPWSLEAMTIALCLDDWDVAEAAELPAELRHHEIAADADDRFDDELQEWFEHLQERPELMLALEQSCHEGVLLPWDMRGVRLALAPADVLSEFHLLIDLCPRHVLVHIAHQCYWLLCSERAGRTGKPEWSPHAKLKS